MVYWTVLSIEDHQSSPNFTVCFMIYTQTIFIKLNRTWFFQYIGKKGAKINICTYEISKAFFRIYISTPKIQQQKQPVEQNFVSL